MVELPWYADTERFAARLELGHRYAAMVADALRTAGVEVEQTPLELRRDLADRHRFAGEIDLTAHTDRGPVVVEVKSRGLPFTDDPATYPFRTAFVAPVEQWDRKPVKAPAVVIISQRTRAMVVVPVRRSFPAWTVETRLDTHTGLWTDSYAVPRRRLVPFATLAAWLTR